MKGAIAGMATRSVYATLERGRRRAARSGRATEGRLKVHIVLMHAYGMGGTIRTVLNLAAHLAERFDVEIISIVRRGDDPFFSFPPNVEVTSLDDSRKSSLRGPRGHLRRLLSLASVEGSPGTLPAPLLRAALSGAGGGSSS